MPATREIHLEVELYSRQLTSILGLWSVLGTLKSPAKQKHPNVLGSLTLSRPWVPAAIAGSESPGRTSYLEANIVVSIYPVLDVDIAQRNFIYHPQLFANSSWGTSTVIQTMSGLVLVGSSPRMRLSPPDTVFTVTGAVVS